MKTPSDTTQARARLLWKPIRQVLPLREGETHLYAAWMDGQQPPADQVWCLLSAQERERAGRFRFDLHRNRFVRGRALLRALLARHLDTEPAEVPLESGRFGKPYLSGESQELQFNMAHSDELLLVGLARKQELGVDLERVRHLDDFDELVARFFSEAENRSFQKLKAIEKPEAFFNLWTRKEAFLKATGEGITFSLQKVEVTFLPGERARFVRLPDAGDSNDGKGRSVENWSLHEVSPGTGYAGAVAMEDIRTEPVWVECSVASIDEFIRETCTEGCATS